MPRKTRTPLVHVHSSGRYDRTAEQIERGLRLYMTRDDADVITLTEQGNHRHRDLIARLSKEYGYTAHQGPGGQDDCVVILKSSRFRAREVWHDELSPLPQNRAKGTPKHHAITVLVDDVHDAEND